MKSWWIISAFVVLYIATHFTNKYVLSVLQFTYPTIFQGWQTLIGFLILTTAGQCLSMDTGNVTRSTVIDWWIGGMLFIGTIYAGSRALSRLSIPIFIILQNSGHIIVAILEWAVQGKIPSFDIQISLLWLLVSGLLVWQNDPMFDSDGYFWMAAHVIFNSFYSSFSANFGKSAKFSEINKLYHNYLLSVVVLIPSIVILGDAFYAKNFPFWFYYKFHVGCILSGLFGTFLNLSSIRLTERLSCGQFAWISFAARVMLVAASFFFFQQHFTPSFVTCLLSGTGSDLSFVYAKYVLRDEKSTTQLLPVATTTKTTEAEPI
ncbi:UDP-N-acetylglucosamine transporter TMEM241 homolog [Saccoglossus kowalevskii]|uniref:Transmembrane protein 241-like n=1 Tax=Saccoglossus kowalevskii TaxID=10224 RepID=A0ABM0GS97_SACKO|nr:PREDICTED: transmembrane protein 241-like [Saccoglossus kowalevskii]